MKLFKSIEFYAGLKANNICSEVCFEVPLTWSPLACRLQIQGLVPEKLQRWQVTCKCRKESGKSVLLHSAFQNGSWATTAEVFCLHRHITEVLPSQAIQLCSSLYWLKTYLYVSINRELEGIQFSLSRKPWLKIKQEKKGNKINLQKVLRFRVCWERDCFYFFKKIYTDNMKIWVKLILHCFCLFFSL